MAVRDQIIADQRTAIGSLWNVLGKLASPERVQEIAAEQGIDMEYAELQLQVSTPVYSGICCSGGKKGRLVAVPSLHQNS